MAMPPAIAAAAAASTTQTGSESRKSYVEENIQGVWPPKQNHAESMEFEAARADAGTKTVVQLLLKLEATDEQVRLDLSGTLRLTFIVPKDSILSAAGARSQSLGSPYDFVWLAFISASVLTTTPPAAPTAQLIVYEGQRRMVTIVDEGASSHGPSTLRTQHNMFLGVATNIGDVAAVPMHMTKIVVAVSENANATAGAAEDVRAPQPLLRTNIDLEKVMCRVCHSVQRVKKAEAASSRGGDTILERFIVVLE